jgi:hypothetical protein
MEGIVRAITVANTPTTMIEPLMTQIISISEACKEKFHYTVMSLLSIVLGNKRFILVCAILATVSSRAKQATFSNKGAYWLLLFGTIYFVS